MLDLDFRLFVALHQRVENRTLPVITARQGEKQDTKQTRKIHTIFRQWAAIVKRHNSWIMCSVRKKNKSLCFESVSAHLIPPAWRLSAYHCHQRTTQGTATTRIYQSEWLYYRWLSTPSCSITFLTPSPCPLKGPEKSWECGLSMCIVGWVRNQWFFNAIQLLVSEVGNFSSNLEHVAKVKSLPVVFKWLIYIFFNNITVSLCIVDSMLKVDCWWFFI